jgi:hypothetical protein
MTFAQLMAAANESKVGRNAGQWTPGACRVWREAEPEDARVLDAVTSAGDTVLTSL